jgi:arylsulfatase
MAGNIKPWNYFEQYANAHGYVYNLCCHCRVKDVAADMMAQKKQYIDGLNNLDYWTGKSKNPKA